MLWAGRTAQSPQPLQGRAILPSSARTEDTARRFARDASSTLGVTLAAAPVPSHPPRGPPPARHSQWRAAPRPSRPPRAPAPANLRPPGDARSTISCHTCPSGSVPPTSLSSPAPSSFTPCHRGASDNRGAAASLPAAIPASYPMSTEPPIPGQARRQRALTCLRFSSTRIRRRHPTPGHQTLGSALACGVSTQARPRRRRPTPAAWAGPWRHRDAPASLAVGVSDRQADEEGAAPGWASSGRTDLLAGCGKRVRPCLVVSPVVGCQKPSEGGLSRRDDCFPTERNLGQRCALGALRRPVGRLSENQEAPARASAYPSVCGAVVDTRVSQRGSGIAVGRRSLQLMRGRCIKPFHWIQVALGFFFNLLFF